MHAIKGVERARFQLDLGGFLELLEVLYVPGLSVSFLSVSSLEDVRYGVSFFRGQVYLHSKGATPTLLGVRSERLYRLLG